MKRSHEETIPGSDPRSDSLWSTAAWLPWLLILIGTGLRLERYLANRSIWLDEALLSMNVIRRSFPALLQPLDHGQVAPVGFLTLQKLAVVTFGNSEHALRLVPLVMGICSLPLCYWAARACLPAGAAVIALCLFVVSEPSIYYASEAKQYSSDVAVGLTILLAALLWRNDRGSVRRLFFLAVAGVAGTWLSHPAVFVLAGVGTALIASEIQSHRWRWAATLFGVALGWALSFLINYSLFLKAPSQNQTLIDYWEGGFMPLPPSSLRDLQWFPSTFFKIFQESVGLPLVGLAGFAFVLGCASLYRLDRSAIPILVFPTLFTLFASGLHRYPFQGRLILFLAPPLLAVIAAGVASIWDRAGPGGIRIGLLILALLLVGPLVTAAQYVLKPPGREEIRPVLDYVSRHLKQGDEFYLHHGAVRAFEFYSRCTERYPFDDFHVRRGVKRIGDWPAYADDLAGLKGKPRVWVVFSHLPAVNTAVAGGPIVDTPQTRIGKSARKSDANEEKLFLFLLDQKGKRLDDYLAFGASTYLYDMSTR